jgi:uncharacterized protein (UPF0305 family)
MDRGIKDILDTVAFIKERVEQLPTEERVREIIREEVPAIVREEIKDLRVDVKAIREELEDLKEKVENLTGFRKEIDHALERIAAIEKHLGIEEKMAA